MSVVEPGILVEIPVNLLNLRHLPTIVFLSLRPIRFLPCLYFGVSLQCDLPRGTIDLLPQPLSGLLVVISLFIAVVFFPSFGFGSCHNHRLCENASRSTVLVKVTQETCSIMSHVLRFIQRVNPVELFVRVVERIRISLRFGCRIVKSLLCV